MQKNHRHHLIGVLAITLLCVVIYSNTISSPFVFDDLPNIIKNPYIRLTSLDFGKLYNAGFKSPSAHRPVANISFALNYYFGEYVPRGYHVVNIIIHLFNGLLVYFLTLIMFKQMANVSDRRLLSSTPQSRDHDLTLMSIFAALVFIAHPIQTQSVTYIVQRMNSMAAMFYLLSLLLYIHGRLARRRGRRWVLFSACLLSGLMALGSKEIAATLPLIILLYEWYFFQNLSMEWLKRNILYVLTPVAIVLLFVLIYLGTHPLDRITAPYVYRDFTMGERALTQFRVVVFYISLLFYPHPSRLNLIHHFTTSQSLLDPITTLLAALLVIGLVGLGIYLAKKQRLVSFCILWFFINLAIESSIIPLEMIFEQRLYLPMFGVSILVMYVLFSFLSHNRSLAAVLSAVIVISLGTATYLRNRVWQEEMTLWSDVLSKNPESTRAHLNVGAFLMQKGSLNEAIAHYTEALRIKPYYVRVHNNLGLALMAIGKRNEAISHYRTALRIRPSYVDARVNLARALHDTGNLDEAISHYEMVLRMDDSSTEAHTNLAIALEEAGRLDEAISHYHAALRLDPNQPDVHYNLALALEDMGKPEEAIAHYNAVLRIRPDHLKAQNHLALVKAVSRYKKALQMESDQAEVHEKLGIALAQQGKLDEAITHFSAALEIRPDSAQVHNNLGIALARKGEHAQAITHFSQALRLDPELSTARQNLELTLEKAKAQTAPAEEIEPGGRE